MTASSAIQIQDQKFEEVGLTKTIVNAERVCTYSRGLTSLSEKNPVLVLLHGYPPILGAIVLYPVHPPPLTRDPINHRAQISRATEPWRRSKKPTNSASAVPFLPLWRQLVTCSSPSKTPPTPIPVILVGHDRGARVAPSCLGVSGGRGRGYQRYLCTRHCK
ncbi:uncharacterized protein EI97DRAFT_232220 [Westerdykella ornata]|uniref:Uncharacterized protein n=1 Tax=Westerdykella ornata TaxID=318751 RepID=A0A6A6J7K5_WESOR|nr:uncharacterized protein EI97DRAFT_232220 [Westerdykella ornata]KAF2272214.1 hypothetical protein EI97DRAFT_232220 [Westerdykella ornata]